MRETAPKHSADVGNRQIKRDARRPKIGIMSPFPPDEVAEALAKVRSGVPGLAGDVGTFEPRRARVLHPEEVLRDVSRRPPRRRPVGDLVRRSGRYQADLVETDPERFFRPPYVGHMGWLGVRLPGIEAAELQRNLSRSVCRRRAAERAQDVEAGAWRMTVRPRNPSGRPFDRHAGIGQLS